MNLLDKETADVKKFWENQADAWTNPDYHFLMTKPNWHAAILSALKPFENHHRRNIGKTLDIGSGGLPSFYHPKSALEKTVALDISKAALLKNPASNRVICDARQPLPFQDASYDSVSCFFLMRYMRNQMMLIDEMLRVLKPGGRIIIADFNNTGLVGGIEQEFKPYELKGNSNLRHSKDLDIKLIDGNPSEMGNPSLLLYFVTASKPRE